MHLFNFLKNDIDCSEKEDYEIERLHDNIHRGKIMAIIVIGIEVICLSIDIISSILKVDDRFAFDDYLAMYVIMLVLNLFFLLLVKRFDHESENLKQHKKRLEFTIVFYVTLVMVWGSAVSLMDQRLYGQLMAFMVNMIVCSVIYLLDHKKIFIPYFASVFVLAIGLPFFQSSSDILIGHYVNLSVFVIISWTASRIIYHNYCENYRSKILLNQSNLLLEKKIEENRKINIKLALANNQLKELAMLDELTAIPNRRSFRDFIDRAFSCFVQEGSTVSVIMIDIDFFKQFNDYYGHEEGDHLLVAIASQINSILEEPSEFVVRWGGDEFIYAAFNKSQDEIVKTANMINTKVSELKIKQEDSYVTVSLGASTIPITEKSDIQKAMKLADQALYLAKSDGRNRVKSLCIDAFVE